MGREKSHGARDEDAVGSHGSRATISHYLSLSEVIHIFVPQTLHR